MCSEDRPVLEPNAAGIDVGAREMFVAVPPGRDENPVRVFATFTEDLERPNSGHERGRLLGAKKPAVLRG
jgi:hypothetical protein